MTKMHPLATGKRKGKKKAVCILENVSGAAVLTLHKCHKLCGIIIIVLFISSKHKINTQQAMNNEICILINLVSGCLLVN